MTTIKNKRCEYCPSPFQTRNGRQRFCTEKCQNDSWRQRQGQDYIRSKHYKSLLKGKGLTLEDYDLELQKQNYVCAICRQPETAQQRSTIRRLSVDHDHETGCYRGLLCTACNLGLGKFQDDIGILRQAVQYLEKNRDPRDNT